MIKTAVFLLFSCCMFGAFAVEEQQPKLTGLEQAILEKFFRTLLNETEFGYVLLGKKPLCLLGFASNSRDDFSPVLYEGVNVWKRLNLGKESPFEFRTTKSSKDHQYELVFFNKERLKEKIKENEVLFQFVIGPTTTPEKFIDSLAAYPEEELYSLLNKNNALVGILLGYGVQNSLYFNRLEAIEEAFYSEEKPPFKPLIAYTALLDELGLSERIKGWLLEGRRREGVVASYPALLQEYSRLVKLFNEPATNLITQKPLHPFFCLRECQENIKILSELKTTQASIRALLKEERFLERVLSLLHSSPLQLLSDKEPLCFFSEEEKKLLPNLLARLFWDEMKEEERSELDFFIQGMGATELKTEDEKSYFKEHFYRLQSTLKKSNECCSSLIGYRDALNNKVHYKILKSGQGERVNGSADLLVQFVLNGKDYGPQLVDLNDTIVGFCYGVQGMQKGEKREVWVHPDYGYGIYTTFDKAATLKFEVELLEIVANGKKPLQQALSWDLEKEIGSISEEEIKMARRNSAYNLGFRLWQDYKNNQELVTLNQITLALQSLAKKPKTAPLSQKDYDLLQRLNWLSL